MTILPPAYDPSSNIIAPTTFTSLTDVSLVSYAGKGGQALRVNAGEDAIESYSLSSSIPNTIYVSSEADLPALNGASEHELAANTNYFFTGSMSIANPIRIVATTTEMSGNGIGMSKVTYTGLGYGVRATNGASSIRMKFMQFISSAGDGIEFVGAGEGSGTNVSLDRAYVFASTGKIASITSVDIFFQEASVCVGLDGISTFGANNGLFYCAATRIITTAAATMIDFGSSIFDFVNGTAVQFIGVAGSSALGGLPDSGNIAQSGVWVTGVVDNGVAPFTGGMSSLDAKWKFNANTGLADSHTLAMGYISTPALTTVADGSPTPIAGIWTEQGDTERASVSAAGVITLENKEELSSKINLTFSVFKSGGGSQSYLFKVQKQALGVGGFVDVEAAYKPVTLTATPSSITILGITNVIETDQYRMVVEGVGTTDSVTVTVANFVIG